MLAASTEPENLGSSANLRLLRVTGLAHEILDGEVNGQPKKYMVLLNGVPLRPHADFAADELAAGVRGNGRALPTEAAEGTNGETEEEENETVRAG